MTSLKVTNKKFVLSIILPWILIFWEGLPESLELMLILRPSQSKFSIQNKVKNTKIFENKFELFSKGRFFKNLQKQSPGGVHWKRCS